MRKSVAEIIRDTTVQLTVAVILIAGGAVVAWLKGFGHDSTAASRPAALSVDCTGPPNVAAGRLVANPGLTDYSTGFGDVADAQLHTGVNRIVRPVQIPRHLQPDEYEIDAEIWPPNKVGANGVQTLTDGFCVGFVIPKK